ncbi:cobalt ECF transporter T component CbiQ [Bacillus solimangrovi]|uniref:Cobalt ECF transporter T component CbiQ n=1 Tax=Bacillus solimangrovi TaxID=1305675 RepID=A0A1E5LGB9_9BACI|nr:cobalt ECF transporter T component CbiQ [Bacillus solimangrovi]OEH93128.1 cobalt ECF transporter T component CbiQ [Bacillus solimangrovi]
MLHIDRYTYENRFNDIHPLEKVIFSFGCLIISIMMKNIVVSLFVFIIMSSLTVFGAGVALRFYLKLLLLPLMFLLMSIGTMIISITPKELKTVDIMWSIDLFKWSVYISETSVAETTILIFIVSASISCMYFLILTTPFQGILWVLQKMKVPTIFLELVVFTYHFIFVLWKKTREIHIAQSARLGYQNYRLWLSSLAQLIVGIFIKSIRSAQELNIAIESRGGEESIPQVDGNYRYNRSSYIFIVSIFSMMLLIYCSS